MDLREIAVESQSFYMPTKIRFGPGSIEEVGQQALALGVSCPLVVTDMTMVSVGVSEAVRCSLRAKGVRFTLYDGVSGEPTVSMVEEAVRVAQEGECDGVIGLGGGSCLDAAKAAAMMLTNDGTLHAYLTGKPIGEPPVPIIAIPTTFGTGSEATAVAVIGNPEAGYKKGLTNPYFYPRVALVDPELGRSIPPLLAATTGMDAFAHALEAYTSRIATPFSDAMALQAMQNIYGHIAVMVGEGRDLDTLKAMASGSTLAGMAFSNASTGLTHALAERVAVFHDLAHGLLVAVLLPYVMEFNVPQASAKYARVARALGIADPGNEVALARRLVEAVRKLYRGLGVPSTLSEIGIRGEHVARFTSEPFRGTNMLYNARVAEQKDVVALYQAAIG